MDSAAFSPASGTALPPGLPVATAAALPVQADARTYLTRVVPWIDGAFVNIHWTVPNRKFDANKPETKGKGTPNQRTFMNGQAFQTLDAAMAWLDYASRQPGKVLDIYACQSAQTQAEVMDNNGRRWFKAIRGQSTVAGLRSLFIDLDVKADGYATPDDAKAALGKFLGVTKLPMPAAAVSSGTGGFHLYWTLDTLLHRDDWQKLANALAEAARRHEFKVDTGCTVDSVRLLRVPGTFNHKANPPLPVTLRPGVAPLDIPLDHMRRALAPYVTARPIVQVAKNSVNSALTAGIETKAPLIDIDSVASVCAFYRDALADNGVAWTNPMWNLGVYGAQFMTSPHGDGRWIAHRISSGHKGYVEADTDALYDRKVSQKEASNSGWPSCAAIQGAGCTSCASCPLLTQGKSPLAHGKPAAGLFPEQQTGAAPDGADDGPAPSEHWAADLFAAQYKEEMKYCHDTGRWYGWTGTAWRPDRVGVAFDWIRQLVQAACVGMPGRFRMAVGKAAYMKGVEQIAKTDPRLRVTSEKWDADPFLLGTEGGTVELATGMLREGRPEERITKQTAVAPAATAACPEWLKFIAFVTQGDAGYARLLQQICGYCLSGSTREQVFFFAYGDGGNGKGVFIHTVSGILGEYAAGASMETFTATRNSQHATYVAALRGARFITANETEHNKRWNDTLLKQFTGDDVIRANFMRQDTIEFVPVGKLLFAGNNKPGLVSVDAAMRRRLKLLPFQNKPVRPDPNLGTKLRTEWPGILRWMIDGFRDWNHNGLVYPTVVVDATAEYFAAQDLYGRWIDENCIVDKRDSTIKTPTSKLFGNFAAYALANHEAVGNIKSFGDELVKRGFEQNKNVPTGEKDARGQEARARGFEGIKLK